MSLKIKQHTSKVTPTNITIGTSPELMKKMPITKFCDEEYTFPLDIKLKDDVKNQITRENSSRG